MMELNEIIILFGIFISGFYYLSVAFFTGVLAVNRGRSFWGWFFLGVIFNFIAFLTIGFMNPTAAEPVKAARKERHEPGFNHA